MRLPLVSGERQPLCRKPTSATLAPGSAERPSSLRGEGAPR